LKTIEIPELALVALIGASGSGKSTFSRKHFLNTEVLSSDFFRGMVSDNENDQSATAHAFDALYYLLDKRLSLGKLTVVDATNVRKEDRKRLIERAKKFHCLAIAIVMNTPEALCRERNLLREDRNFGAHVIHRQVSELRKSMRGLEAEGFRYVHFIDGSQEVEIRRTKLYNNLKHLQGPFDIIGDVHGCCDELRELLGKLGWQQEEIEASEPWGTERWFHPEGRHAVFVGDLVDRGPKIMDTIGIVYNMIQAGHASCVAGNHDIKLSRWLRGKKVQVTHGLEQSIAEMAQVSEEGKNKIASFLDRLVSHYVFDDGQLVVAHAGLVEEMHGRASAAVRSFAMFGETTGEIDEFGLPVRYNWAKDYRGSACVVYGHTPVPSTEWINNTINIDTGAVFGGSLTALRYPEREFASVESAREYATPLRPLFTPPTTNLSPQQELDDVLDLEDVSGKRFVATRYRRTITVLEENSIAALEIMSRFGIDPRWLIYLPPTMSPCATSVEPGYLEYPAEAFAYFKKEGIKHAICEEKHMGSRAVVVVCRSEEAAQKRFGVVDDSFGACFTRTGRPFFAKPGLEKAFLLRIQNAITESDLWEKLDSDWFCLDCELMPWSAKAQQLIERQYAAVGAAATAAFDTACESLSQSPSARHLLEHFESRRQRVSKYRDAYRRYCWPVDTINDYKLAPFHLLASEGMVYEDKTHQWHMSTLRQLAEKDPELIIATACREVDLDDDVSIAEATCWWENLTQNGGEGMVVKPSTFVAKGVKGLVQPAVKCRGREYLRIIYGPEYDSLEQLPRLRSRGLGRKRSLASSEFLLGLESLHRFVERQPLRKVHECVFAVLALESEPIDPRL
jgi:protein phosphatase